MIRRVLLAIPVLLLPALATAQVKMLRMPTYFKGKVAFSYLGDICVAARVSIPHPARTWKTSA
ncbi:MAG: hypothetical protein ABSH56_03640 [Bryobacteraceae bacterium]|jgi:hypothetical protein